jgi:hypothetical protein
MPAKLSKLAIGTTKRSGHDCGREQHAAKVKDRRRTERREAVFGRAALRVGDQRNHDEHQTGQGAGRRADQDVETIPRTDNRADLMHGARRSVLASACERIRRRRFGSRTCHARDSCDPGGGTRRLRLHKAFGSDRTFTRRIKLRDLRRRKSIQAVSGTIRQYNGAYSYFDRSSTAERASTRGWRTRAIDRRQAAG